MIKRGGVRISCSKQAEAKSARGNHPGLSDPSCPSELSRIPCQCTALRTTVVFLCRSIERILKNVSLHRAKKVRFFYRAIVLVHFKVRFLYRPIVSVRFKVRFLYRTILLVRFSVILSLHREEIFGSKKIVSLYSIFFSRDCVSVSL